MAGRRQDLETRLIAKDDASHVIDKVADELDKLDKRTVEVGVGVEDKASDDIKTIDRRLDGLSDEDKTIVLRAQATQAQREIDGLLRSLARVDRMDDEEVQIRVKALGDARQELARIEAQAERLDKEKVDITVDVDDRATGRLAHFRTQLAEASGGFGKISAVGKMAFDNLSGYAAEAGIAAAAAIGLFVKSAVTDFQTLALEVGKMRDALGIPAEEASRLKEVVEDLGIPIDAFKAAVVRMNRAAETTPEAFDSIHAAVVRSDEGVLDVTQTFLGVATALDAIPDAGERAAAGAKIFGKGWTQIAELVEKGGLSIAEAMEKVGAAKVIDDEDIKNAKAMRDSIDGLKDRFEEFSNTVGESVIPIVTQLSDGLQIAGSAFGEFIDIVTGDFNIPVLDKVARYGFPVTGQILLMADAWGGAKKELDDFRGVTEGTVDPMLRTVSALGDLNTELFELADPLSVLPDQWRILMEDMADGTIDTQAAADAANNLAAALGKETPEVLGIAARAWEDNKKRTEAALEAYNAAIAESKQFVLDYADAIKQAAVNIADTDAELLDLAGTFKQIGVKGQALRSVFDLKNAPLEAEGAIRDIELAIDDLSTAAEGIDLSAGLDPSDIDADALLDAIDSLRPQIQAKVVDAFSAGGPEAATAMANDYVAQVAKELDISEIEAAKLLGMEDVEALVRVAIEQTSLANARAQLELLTGIPGADPIYTATIAMALDAGSITPRQAQILIQDALRDVGVTIPNELDIHEKPGALAAAQAALQAGADANPLEQDLLAQPAGLKEAQELAQDYMGRNPLHVDVIPVLRPLSTGVGSAGGGGAPIGLAAGPMALTAEAGVTPMAAPTLPTLLLPVSAPRAAAVQPIVQNITLQAAVIGDQFDVARTVEEAMRRAARLWSRTP